jgi:hypothetical protein
MVPPPVGGASTAAAAGSLADGLTDELLVRDAEVASGTSSQVVPRRAARRQVIEDSIPDIPDGWETGKLKRLRGVRANPAGIWTTGAWRRSSRL